MTDQTTTTAQDAVLSNIGSNLTTIAKTDGLKAVVPVLDSFLTAVSNNQAGTAGLATLVHALGPELLAALPQAGAQGVKDVAGELKSDLDAAAAKAETSK